MPKRQADDLCQSYLSTRNATVRWCEPLETEDFVVQSMPDASPVKWHLAHTTWFFATFVLESKLGCPETYPFLFNSYYEGAGPQFSRPRRGTLSRPTVREVLTWRQRVDEAVVTLLDSNPPPTKLQLIELGIHHEQQHQELMVTDLKHALCTSPIDVALVPQCEPSSPPSAQWKYYDGGMVTVGAKSGTLGQFSFDNEGPRHETFLHPFALSTELVTNAEYLEFMEDGGYQDPRLWLSDAWYWLQSTGIDAPLYWERKHGAWFERSLGGRIALRSNAPVAHVSQFEADAYARWRQARLPLEHEWEAAMSSAKLGYASTFETGTFHPAALRDDRHDFQLALGEVWEHTSSPYRPYPGFCIPEGVVGEYNGKFMNNQYVLKGGSCATPQTHIRLSYRNFFPPDKRWNFTGIRLAKGPNL